MPRTVAFFSYTRLDDRTSRGLLSAVREELEAQVSTRLGEQVEIFQDTDDIKGGDNWRAKLATALAEAQYLIPIITPSFFNSRPCRDELKRFVDKADELDRDDLIIPVHFIESDVIQDAETLTHDALVKVIEETQWLNWEEHNHKTEIDGNLRRTIIDLAKLIVRKVKDDAKPKTIKARSRRENARMALIEMRFRRDIVEDEIVRLGRSVEDLTEISREVSRKGIDQAVIEETLGSEFLAKLKKMSFADVLPRRRVLPPGFLDELRNRLALSDVVGRKVLWDKRKSNAAKGDFWAPCPFHQEKTPSFHVDDRKGFYYCFGCHAKGDAITFVKEIENVSFIEAVEILAREATMKLPD